MQWTVIEKQQQKQSKVLSENLKMKKKYQFGFGMFNEKVNIPFLVVIC